MPHCIKSLPHIKVCHIGFFPLITEGLDSLLQDESSMGAANVLSESPSKRVQGRRRVLMRDFEREELLKHFAYIR